MTIKIDKDIPIEPKGIYHVYPLAEMEVGDSFAIPDGHDIPSARGFVFLYGARNGKKFSIRKRDGWYRCWRKK